MFIHVYTCILHTYIHIQNKFEIRSPRARQRGLLITQRKFHLSDVPLPSSGIHYVWRGTEKENEARKGCAKEGMERNVKKK